MMTNEELLLGLKTKNVLIIQPCCNASLGIASVNTTIITFLIDYLLIP